MDKSNVKFIDKRCNDNLKDGFAFYACGLITEVHSRTPTQSRKDVVVEYINPWGKVETSWRSLDEIHTSAISTTDYANMASAIQRTKLLNTLKI